MDLDPTVLSRIQFAANMSFHILFPTITIAMGWILLFFKLRFSHTRDPKWMECYFFWTKVFALCFALGVVSGITMSFQFGTNWPGYMLKVGNVAGPLLAYEVLTAFFLEATFLGIMFFGFRRVPGWVHTLATSLVAGGTTLSAFWILALNSWMHTPSGFEMVDGVAHATNWFKIIFNPSMPYRLTHMLLVSGLTASFMMAGVSAYRWLYEDRKPAVLAALKTGVTLAAILIPLQILAGDAHGLNTLKYQPQKIAAMEGLWETRTHAPLVLFAAPDEKAKTNRWAVEVPGAASLVLSHHWDGEIKGLNEFKDHPPVAPVFYGFRLMVGMGLLMLAVSWTSLFFIYRKKSVPPVLCRILIAMTFAGWVATISGWYVTEIGRQPFLVTGILRTVDAVGPVPGHTVLSTLIAYLTLYAFLLGAFITTVFHMAKKARELEHNDPVNPVQGDWGAVIAGKGDTHDD